MYIVLLLPCNIIQDNKISLIAYIAFGCCDDSELMVALFLDFLVIHAGVNVFKEAQIMHRSICVCSASWMSSLAIFVLLILQ